MRRSIRQVVYKSVRLFKLDILISSYFLNLPWLRFFLPGPLFYTPEEKIIIRRKGATFKILPHDLVQWFLFTKPNRKYGVEELIIESPNFPDDPVILDIGANIGQFSLMASHWFKTQKSYKNALILSLEPVHQTYAYLQSNISLNANSNNQIKIFNIGLSDEVNKSKINIPLANSGASSIINKPTGIYRTEPIELITLDQFFIDQKLSKINFLKIDAECSEIRILKGAQMTLKKYLPGIFIEILPDCKGSNYNDIHNFLMTIGYQLYIMVENNILPLSKEMIKDYHRNKEEYALFATVFKISNSN